jgi:hypothetical protein
MGLKCIAIGVVLITSTAMAQSPMQGNAPGSATSHALAQPTLSPTDREAQNPLVNPSAAGTQTGLKGPGASSSAVAAHRIGSDNSARHIGLDDQGSVTPGAGKPLISRSPSPPAARATTPGEARERLKQLGYSHITQLQQVGPSLWEAVARRDNREVRVTLDTEGTVVGERSTGRARAD